MKSIVILLLLAISAQCCLSATVSRLLNPCKPDQCKLPNCLCYGNKPSIEREKRPQIVVISVDDGIKVENYEELYKPFYVGRKNPNGCQIGVTFFVSHDNTDYNVVHKLYAAGFEIGVNSLTKNSSSEYWQTANETQLIEEFQGQKDILEKFAKINVETIKGVRTPLLQISGDISFYAYRASGLLYDNSWPTRANEWPYTLDYDSEQGCKFGVCPTNSFPGFWVLPINDWYDQYGNPCATVQGCINKPQESVEKVFEWLKWNFDKVYLHGDKSPFNIIANAGLFIYHYPKAYQLFLDYIQSFDDVYIVNQYEAIQWMQNPLPLGNINLFKCNKKYPHDDKKAKSCNNLPFGKEIRRMVTYNEPCPNVFPWLGNPMGL